MAIQRLSADSFEQFTLELHPKRTFASGSSTSIIRNGITGSIGVFPRASSIQKDIESVGAYNDSEFIDDSLRSLHAHIVKEARNTTNTNISSAVSTLLSRINSETTSSKLGTKLSITRFNPPVRHDFRSFRKLNVKEVLFPFYRQEIPSAHWAFTNYHTLNFFTASSVPSNTVLIYPSTSSQGSDMVSGSYNITGAFSFDFHINPRYTPDEPHGNFHAGTIFFMSASYALSLISGSRKDKNGYTEGFRLQLQLSRSANIKPSIATLGNSPSDLIFLSNDNSLLRNHWHHATVRWGTDLFNDGSGSFVIDNQECGNFVIPSASIASVPETSSMSTTPRTLFIGNYYDGPSSGTNSPTLFFANRTVRREGLLQLSTSDVDEPAIIQALDHPLNAEVHDLKIYSKYLTNAEIEALSKTGPTTLNDPDLRFYVPPFFTRESPTRTYVNTYGGIMQTPFFEIDGTTVDPFNVALSFGIDGHMINLENFTRDMAQGVYPRLYNLTASVITTTSEEKTANEFLYATSSLVKRNLTILPCDDGSFKPNFRLLLSGAVSLKPESGSLMDQYVADDGTLDLSLVSLNNMLVTSSLRTGLVETRGNLLSGVVGSTPENPGVDPGETLTIYQRTRDNSSNAVTLFDISNLYYGNRIQPSTFKLVDQAITGSSGKINITLRDDGHGNLYRADSTGSHATWASVGNVLYSEGIAVVKDPTLCFFGIEQFVTEFKGEHNIHTFKVHATAQAGQVNSSSNPNFKVLSASLNAYDDDAEFVYISGVQFHDADLNVIMRSNLAQPIVKRHGEKIRFLARLDF